MWKNSNENMVVTCKDCGEQFTLSKDDRNWYERRGYKLPKRCQKCRAKRREDRKENV